jgi:hypothetical protein
MKSSLIRQEVGPPLSGRCIYLHAHKLPSSCNLLLVECTWYSLGWLISVGWDYVSEPLPLTDILSIPHMIRVEERRWNDIDREKSYSLGTFASTGLKICKPSAYIEVYHWVSWILMHTLLSKWTWFRDVVKCKSNPATRHGGAWGERRYSSYSFMTSAVDGVSGQHHAPTALYPPG